MADLELVERARKGDEEAMSELYSRYSNLVLHTAYHIVGNWADAEDIMQDVFVASLTTSSPFQGRSSAKTWFLRLTVNRALNLKRRIRRWLLRSEVAERDVPAPQTDWTWLLEEIRRLPEKQRVVLVLRYFHDLSEAETASILQCPPGTVKSRLHHAVNNLRAHLDPSVFRQKGVVELWKR